jgi:hypothetical protein
MDNRAMELTLARMAKEFLPYSIDQRLLLPLDMRDWLPEGHLALFVDDLVEQFDLNAIDAVSAVQPRTAWRAREERPRSSRTFTNHDGGPAELLPKAKARRTPSESVRYRDLRAAGRVRTHGPGAQPR